MVLDACGEKIVDVMLSLQDYTRDAIYLLWRCHNLRTLRLHDEPSRIDDDKPVEKIYHKTWASATITTLDLFFSLPALPEVVLSLIDATMKHIVGLEKYV